MAEIQTSAEVIDLTGLSESSESDGEAQNQHEDDDDEGGSEHGSEGSDGSEIEITLNANTRAHLQNAIATVSETRLRQVLNILIEADITIEAALTRELVTLKRGTQDLVPRWESCANCDEEYDVNTLRSPAECRFHPGNVARPTHCPHRSL